MAPYIFLDVPTESASLSDITKLLKGLMDQLHTTHEPAVRINLLKVIRLLLAELDKVIAADFPRVQDT